MRIVNASSENIAKAAEMLTSGQLVAFPTETVYGLGANACDDDAIRAVYKAKGRPSHNPLIIHVHNMAQAMQYAEFSDLAKNVASQFWPGPLTLVLKAKPDNGISELATAGLDTIAIRCPAHPVANAIIKRANLPIAAPSANASGSLSPTRPIHVKDSLGNNVPFIIADGACGIGLESTVLDLSCDKPALLRYGGVTEDDLEPVTGALGAHTDDNEKPRSPGQLSKHYAPRTPVRLNAVDVKKGEALLAFGSVKFMGVEGGGAAVDLPDNAIRNLSKSQDLHEAAVNLFSMLHELDQFDHVGIAVMNVPDVGIGKAINDRLFRATIK